MAKLTLKLESLRVETFATDAALARKGTVVGAQISAYTGCDCPPYSEQDGCTDYGCSDTCIPTGGIPSCFRCGNVN